MKGFQSIGEGMCSMFSWLYPRDVKEIEIDIDAAFKDYYEKHPEYQPVNEWHYTERFIPILPQPQQAKTPLRNPARKYNRR
jgi:hypothetical protein